MNKLTIMRNFSRHAHIYDRYALIQKQAARELLAQIKENTFARILEIGCGTGNYTILLRDRFKNAGLKAVDISKEMIEIAAKKLKNEGVKFIVADAEKISLSEKFDLITSNACFQWFSDLEKALIFYKSLLKKEGVITFSIFGPLTFWELDTALKCCAKKISASSSNFIGKEKLEVILKENFKGVEIKEAAYEEKFSCLRDLLYKIKYTGIRGDGLDGKIFFTPRVLKKLEGIYLDKFKQIKASSQIFYCRGQR